MNATNEDAPPSHFKGKDAISHVAEAQAKGLISSAEIHGTETPGRLSAAADAARDSAIVLLLFWGIFTTFNLPPEKIGSFLLLLGNSFLVWKAGRSAWLGWSRLERLHRILAQEKWEIEHHRQQERDELRVLYAAKGFEGKLLEDVLDVLMADGDRLLRVMVQEELGLSLEVYDHPLMQSLGAALGVLFATIGCILGFYASSQWGVIIAALAIISSSAAITAHHADNRPIPAIVWNLGLTALTFGTFYFLTAYFFPKELTI